MNFVNKKILVITCWLLLTTLTGCFPKVDDNSNHQSVSSIVEHSENSTKNSENITFSKHIENNDIESLKIDADVILPIGFEESKVVYSASAKNILWNRDELISKVSNGRILIDEQSYEDSGPDDTIYNYTFDDNSEITFALGRISYDTEKSKDYQYSHYFDSFKNYIFTETMDNIFGKDDIDGINKSEALELSNEIISMIGIKNIVSKPNVYSMNVETMRAIQETDNSTNKFGEQFQAWNEEQEAYLITYPVTYDEIPLSKIFAVGTNKMILPSNVYFIFSREGLISFKIENIYSVENINDASMICNPEKAIEIVKTYFNNIILDKELTIKAIKLEYVIQSNLHNNKEVELVPVWFIYGEYEEENNSIDKNKLEFNNKEYITLVNALSCETIPINSIGG